MLADKCTLLENRNKLQDLKSDLDWFDREIIGYDTVDSYHSTVADVQDKIQEAIDDIEAQLK